MALVTTTEMFKKAYDGGYAVGAFNVYYFCYITRQCILYGNRWSKRINAT